MKGRRIVITGAASGIGAACAKAIVAKGGRVACLDQHPIDPATSGLKGSAFVQRVDVTDEVGVSQAIEAAGRWMEGIDGVINAAGIVFLRPLEEITPADWRKMFAVNVEGSFLVCQAALPWLRQHPECASIVNIASAQALLPVPLSTAYAASKGAVLSFSKALAAELAPIRVNCLCPGLIDTPMNRGLTGEKPPVSLERYALKRWGQPEEIAEAALFLLSQSASYMTGATISVDGGRTFH